MINAKVVQQCNIYLEKKKNKQFCWHTLASFPLVVSAKTLRGSHQKSDGPFLLFFVYNITRGRRPFVPFVFCFCFCFFF